MTSGGKPDSRVPKEPSRWTDAEIIRISAHSVELVHGKTDIYPTHGDGRMERHWEKWNSVKGSGIPLAEHPEGGRISMEDDVGNALLSNQKIRIPRAGR